MVEKANLLAAGLFYLLFVGALVYFVVAPGVNGGEMREVVLRGALFGLVTYATYDLTNLATLREWSLTVTIVDLAWGTVLTAATSALSVWAALKFWV